MNILQWIGARSRCCNAKFHYKYGWDYKEDGWVCSACGIRKEHHTDPKKRTETIGQVSRGAIEIQKSIKEALKK